MKQQRYRVTLDLVFDPEEPEDIEGINPVTLMSRINAALAEGSYNFFGESICMAGLLTPEVTSVKKL